MDIVLFDMIQRCSLITPKGKTASDIVAYVAVDMQDFVEVMGKFGIDIGAEAPVITIRKNQLGKWYISAIKGDVLCRPFIDKNESVIFQVVEELLMCPVGV